MSADIDVLTSELRDLQLREHELRQTLANIQQEQKILIQELSHRQRTIINSLPAEILLKIFSTFVHDTREFDTELHSDESAFNALLISHICQFWRVLALSTSSLWTCVSFRHVQLAKIFVRRSGRQQVDIVRQIPKLLEFNQREPQMIVESIAMSYSRWRSLIWDIQGEHELLWLFPLVFRQPLNAIREMKLSGPNRTFRSIVHGLYIQSTQLPALEEFRLHNILLTEVAIKITCPSLRSLSFKYNPDFTHKRTGFTVSSLRSFLQGLPNLEDFSLIKCTPLWDVILDHGMRSTTMSHTNLTSDHIPFCGPLRLGKLRVMEWTLAPPKDLHRFFCLFICPALCELKLDLNLPDQRWNTPAQGQRDLTGRNISLPVELPSLERLEVSARDPSSLLSGLKKLHFPALKSLSFSHIKNHLSEDARRKREFEGWPPPELPTLDTMLFEPRVANLTHLELVDSVLVPSKTLAMLDYTLALEHLVVDWCTGFGPVVCALSGAPTCHSPMGGPRKWHCPRLTSLVIIDCDDVKFSCLADMVLARKRYSEGTAGARTERRIKPLRKMVRMQANMVVTPPVTPTKGLRADVEWTAPSPNGSRIAGWSAHEPGKPKAIRMIHVEACNRIAQAELLSLQDEEYGVEEVYWS